VRQLDAASSAQIRLATATNDLETLLQIQLSEENAVRGFVVTRDPSYLDAEQAADPDFDETVRKLDDALRRQGLERFIPLVGDMKRAHDAWERQVAVPLVRAPRGAGVAAMQTTGKLITDQISGDALRLRAELTSAGTEVQRALRRRINATVAISAGFVTLFAIVALAYAIAQAQAISRLERERALVDALQRTLRVGSRRLPRTQMGTAYASATRETLVGGDLLDAWRAGPDDGWFLIADASGKGIGAARHAAFAQYAIRALAAGADDPADVVARFNRLFLDTFEDPSSFMVLFLAALDGASGTLRYASAGHATAYVVRGDAVEQLPPTGAIVGMDAGEPYATGIVALDVGDLVMLATDGLSEARSDDGELFGEERIVDVLREGPREPQALCDLLVASADAFSGGVQDDLAIVALRFVDEDMPAPGSAPPRTRRR
jgi:serine phosphatase RsbU (regulator of sigma subunit)